ncbi:MAG TPA: glycosyltransferase family 2 protein [Frankiaceae bacterium]|nr:glycosyltransferase family 2 protein [Frankiaceae bacterium]
MTRATVVVVNWNGGSLISECLDGLAKQDTTDFETWVADNASTDGSVELVRRDYPWARVIDNGANLGFAGGNNAALRQVTTPYVVLLNNDAVPEPDWLSRTLAALDEHPEAGCVTPKILFLPRFVRVSLTTDAYVPGPHDARDLGVRIHAVAGTDGKPLWEKLTWGPEAGFTWTRPSGFMLLPVADGPATVTITWAAERAKDVTLSWDGGSVTLPVGPEPGTVSFEIPATAPRLDVLNNAGGIVFTDGYGADRAFQEVDDGSYDEGCEVFAFCGNGVAFRREVLDDVGLFDDDFFLYYEDTDLSWRVRARGHAIRYEPAAVLRHRHASSTGEQSPVFRFHVDRNRLLMLTKSASGRLAAEQVLRYPLTTASIALRGVRSGNWRGVARPTLLRLRVMASFLRLLPRMLERRRAIDARRTVPRRDLERSLVPRP